MQISEQGQKISEIPGVRDAFQLDRDLQPLYESSYRATGLGGIVSVGLKFAENLARLSGQGNLDRVVISSDRERLMVFALNYSVSQKDGPEVFGLLTDPNAQLEVMAEQVAEIVKEG